MFCCAVFGLVTLPWTWVGWVKPSSLESQTRWWQDYCRSPKGYGQCVKTLYRPWATTPFTCFPRYILRTQPTGSQGCVRSLSSSSFVSLTLIEEYSKYLRVIAGIGLITCSLEFLQCVFCSQRSHTTFRSCQAVTWRGLSQWLRSECE